MARQRNALAHIRLSGLAFMMLSGVTLRKLPNLSSSGSLASKDCGMVFPNGRYDFYAW